jgi:hypothetical protein
MIRPRQMSLGISLGSLKRKIPSITTLTAPIPVHTAYAVPSGIYFITTESKVTLIIIVTIVNAVGHNFVKPSVYFSPMAQKHSKIPAIINKSQDIKNYSIIIYKNIILHYTNQFAIIPLR